MATTTTPERTPTETTNLDRYGFAALPWSRPKAALDAISPGDMLTWFLGTVSPEGIPHAAGIGAMWFEGDIYFTAGLGTRKARHLGANPNCTISVHLPGIDLVFEGSAEAVSDDETLNKVVKVFNDGGWPATVENGAFTAPYSAPSAGPPPWHLWRMRAATVYAVSGEEPYGATRWRFDR